MRPLGTSHWVTCAHTAHTCRSPFLGALSATRGVCSIEIHRDPRSGHATTSAAYARVRLVAYVRTQPPSVLIESVTLIEPAGREHGPFDDGRIMRRKHWPSMPSNPEDRRSAASKRLSGGLASTAATTRTFAAMATSWRRRCCSPSLCSHHLLPKLPNPVAERGSVDASFSGGKKVGSRLKRCLP